MFTRLSNYISTYNDSEWLELFGNIAFSALSLLGFLWLLSSVFFS